VKQIIVESESKKLIIVKKRIFVERGSEMNCLSNIWNQEAMTIDRYVVISCLIHGPFALIICLIAVLVITIIKIYEKKHPEKEVVVVKEAVIIEPVPIYDKSEILDL